MGCRERAIQDCTRSLMEILEDKLVVGKGGISGALGRKKYKEIEV